MFLESLLGVYSWLPYIIENLVTMSHCHFKLAIVQTSVHFVGGDLATVCIFRLSVMTRCHKVIVYFHSLWASSPFQGASGASCTRTCERAACCQGQGKAHSLTHTPLPPTPCLLFSCHLSWLISPNGKIACRLVVSLSVSFNKKE